MASLIRSRAAQAVRTYATEASSKHIVTPIPVTGIAGKYAAAAYAAALRKSSKTLDQVDAELSAARAAIKEDPKIKQFIENPTLPIKEKEAGIAELLKRAKKDGAPSEITQNLFNVLAENGRLYEADKVIEDFQAIMSAHRGEVTVTITTAEPISKDLQSRLESSLKNSSIAGKGKSLKVTNKVNPTILGGLVVDFGDKTIDLSVSARVNKLNSLIQTSV